MQSIIIPDGVISIASYAFSECAALTQVTIPNSVKYIFSYAFNKTGLTSVEIPNSVVYLGGYAFRDCPFLKTLKLGNGLSTIPYGSFKNSPISEIRCGNLTPYKVESTAFDSLNQASCTLYVPDISSDQYSVANYWSGFTTRLTVSTPSNKQNAIVAYMEPGSLVIRNTKRNEVYSIYSTTGMLVKSYISPGGEIRIKMPEAGIYIVKNAREVLKVRAF